MGASARTRLCSRRARPIRMKRATGIGGVFFRAKNPKRLAEWYSKHLGLSVMDAGGPTQMSIFSWRESGPKGRTGMTVWAAHPRSSDYFGAKNRQWMINYRVADLELLLAQLRRNGVKEAKPMETSDFGKFGWIVDPEGNRVELWEPPAPERSRRRR